MGCGDVTVLEARAVCVCDMSPLGHFIELYALVSGGSSVVGVGAAADGL
jgi:hypothetical protein